MLKDTESNFSFFFIFFIVSTTYCGLTQTFKGKGKGKKERPVGLIITVPVTLTATVRDKNFFVAFSCNCLCHIVSYMKRRLELYQEAIENVFYMSISKDSLNDWSNSIQCDAI